MAILIEQFFFLKIRVSGEHIRIKILLPFLNYGLKKKQTGLSPPVYLPPSNFVKNVFQNDFFREKNFLQLNCYFYSIYAEKSKFGGLIKKIYIFLTRSTANL